MLDLADVSWVSRNADEPMLVGSSDISLTHITDVHKHRLGYLSQTQRSWKILIHIAACFTMSLVLQREVYAYINCTDTLQPCDVRY